MEKSLRRAVERHPLLWAAAMAAAAVLAADGWCLVGLTGSAVLLVLLISARKWWVLMGAVGLALVAGTSHFSEVARRGALMQEMGDGMAGPIEARLLEEPRSAAGGWAALAEVVATGDRVWILARGQAAGSGAVVAGNGVYQPIEGPRNPGQFDLRPWLTRRGAFAAFQANGRLRVVEPPPSWHRLGQGIRAGFRESVTRGLDPLSREAAVIRAVVLGEHPDDDVLIDPFRRSGTLHVFAVSGLHVGMVGLIGWFVLRMAGASRRGAVVPLIILMLGYAWLTGMKPPAMRAAWMAAVVLGAFWFRRRPDVINALGLAALLMLLRDGDLLFQAGVQLSFGVVFAIGMLHRTVGRAFAWIRWEEPYLPRSLYGPWRERWFGFRRWMADMLTVSSSAWLGSAPLTALHFGLMTPVSIVASVALFVVVFPLLGLALLSAAVSPLPGVSERINAANGFLAASALTIAKTGAAVPGGNFAVPRGRPADEFLIVYDVGGDGAAVWKGEEACVLIDSGSRRSFDRVVMRSLRGMALRPDKFVVTHPDGGHVGGMTAAVDAFPMTEGLVPVLRAKSSNFRAMLSAGDERGVKMIRGRRGRSYGLGNGAELEVVWEPDAWNWNDVADQRVMPVMLHWHGWRILFMGDAGWASERAMMEGGAGLAADVIVAGRHIHDASLGVRFLEATGARVVIATHSNFPSAERIPDWWRESCEARGVQVFHQGESGAVSGVLDEGALLLKGFVDGKVLRLEKPGSF
ncbi:ComEC/Rec2 family competence protein [Haloferula chungangensis]|uniref:ComEC/Rec2 family competence protein n=1 Tax=Haloferula chungangensis TaxID=1048331 RepID=A0ABW2L9K6_9BACT